MRWAALLLVGLLAGCGTPGLALDPNPGPYDVLSPGGARLLSAARHSLDAGDAQRAGRILTELVHLAPDHLATGTFLQEVELRLLAGDADGLTTLQASYLARAQTDPTPVGFVLAARLAPSEVEALALLDRAVELDADCIWAHYGRAFWLFRGRRFPEAREAMQRARDLDPGHWPTLRLYGTMLASAGETGLAIKALTAWLARTEADPLVLAARRAEARTDLAALLVLDGRAEDALELLPAIDGTLLADGSRLETVRAAAHHGQGDVDLALAAARRAGEAGTPSLLALVQEAMLIEQTSADLEAERAIWERLLAAADRERDAQAALPVGERDTEVDFQSLLIQLMAHTRLERLRRAEPALGGAEGP